MANGVASKSKSTFRQECSVSIRINASPERLWALLTTAQDMPRWNSTITSVEGRIASGETIKLKVTAAPQRVFTLKVSEWTPNRRMVWRDGAAPMFQGVRTYTLTPSAEGATEFAMVEVFSGLMLPMIAGSLPDFGPSFEQYAADLKKEAEKQS
ncbi:MAG: SRPBCC domain-containing protein [Anaerolineae bacterium]